MNFMQRYKKTCSLILVSWLFIFNHFLFAVEAVNNGNDTDDDGITNGIDNCVLVSNPAQRDTNNNGKGNWCDGDLDKDGDVDWNDINRSHWFYGVLGDDSYHPDADINGDNIVNATDTQLIKNMMNNINDTDSDGIANHVDNCILIANPAQRDSNNDGYGNWCDGDLDQDGDIDWNDVNRSHWFFGVLGDGSYHPDADINGDNIVNSTDTQLIKDMMNKLGKPGPSATVDTVSNKAPTISGSPLTSVQVDSSYNFTPLASDENNDELSFSITNKPDWIEFNAGNGEIKGIPQESNIGNHSNIIITVTDGKDSTSLAAFSINVKAVNNINDTDGDGIANHVDNCILIANPAQRDSDNDGYGNWCDGDLDQDGDIDWNDVNRSHWFFGVLGDDSYNPDADINGDNIVNTTDTQLIKEMMNNLGKPGPSATGDTVSNKAPTISGSPLTSVKVDSSYNFTPLASDENNDSLSFSITNKPDWIEFNAENGEIKGIPQESNIGNHSDITITVTDGKDSTSLTAFSIIVEVLNSEREGFNIAGCKIFPDNNFWNTPIINYPLHPKNIDYIQNIGRTTALHPDFGDGVRTNGQLQSAYGISYVAVSNDPEKYLNDANIYKKSELPVTFRWWDESDCQIADTTAGKICQSDKGNYPTPAEKISQVANNTGELSKIIEAGTDKHLVSIDADTCQLYEVQHYNYTVNGNTITNVTGDSGAIWNLSANEQRIANHTSADAAGLAILPGLVKFDEVFVKYDPINGHEYGEVNHAIRMTLNNPQNAYILPATHSDGNQHGGCEFSEDSNCLPMGQKLRLKMSIDEINNSDFSEANKVILRALRTYGVVIADTGSNMYISGNHDPRWANNDVNLNALKQLTAADFEAVIKPTGERVYDYSWNSGASAFYTAETSTPDFGDDEFEFIVFGDFNQGGCERNQRVIELINLMAAKENNSAAFYVSTGDMIDGYVDNKGGNLSFATSLDNSSCGDNAPDGNINQMLSPIKQRPPVKGLKASFYPAIGNHDGGWGSNWYPDPWGKGICDMLEPNTPMDFINHDVPDLSGGVLTPTAENYDTINSLFCNKTDRNSSLHPDDFFYSFTYKNSHFIVLSLSNDYQSLSSSQMSFLERELMTAKNEGKHIFVFAHAPLYTTNFDRHRATQNWRAYTDLFDTYNVDMYINGHNHSYERSYALKGDPNDTSKLIRDDSGTVYLTVGSAGGGSDGTPDINNPLTEVTVMAPNWTQVRNWSKSAFAREITVYLKVKVKGSKVSFEATTIGLDNIQDINSGGNIVPLDQIILGSRQVDTGSLRKYD